MISGSLVNRVFETANRRIWSYRTDSAAIDMPPRVTPHWMRHAFGMHLMWTLMHDLIERDNRLTRLLREHDEPGLRAYGQSVMWPVQVVQELMRHRSTSKGAVWWLSSHSPFLSTRESGRLSRK